jgi:hypothetical protein
VDIIAAANRKENLFKDFGNNKEKKLVRKPPVMMQAQKRVEQAKKLPRKVNTKISKLHATFL